MSFSWRYNLYTVDTRAGKGLPSCYPVYPVFSTVQDIKHSTDQLNRDLDLISGWAHQWKMLFNPDPQKQAQEVIFSRKTINVQLSRFRKFLPNWNYKFCFLEKQAVLKTSSTRLWRLALMITYKRLTQKYHFLLMA